jgi:hypothetical protein
VISKGTKLSARIPQISISVLYMGPENNIGGVAIRHASPLTGMHYSSLKNMADASARNCKGGAAGPHQSTVRPVISSPPNPWSTRRVLSIVAAATLGALPTFWFSGASSPSDLKLRWHAVSEIEWGNRREQVKDAFVSSWDAYSKYAWGESNYLIQNV